jgi:HK97 family phage major capsid protein
MPFLHLAPAHYKGLTMPSIKAQLETLSKTREDARQEAKDLLDSARENGQFDDSVQAQADELLAKAEEADGNIKALIERDKQISARFERLQGFADHTASINNANGVNFDGKIGGDQPQRPKITQRYGTLQHFSGETDGMPAAERAYRFGAWAMAKLANDMPQHFGGAFRTIRQFAADQFGVPMMGHGEGADDTSGSHVFVPDEFGNDLIRLREMYGVARRIMRYLPMTSDTRNDPRWASGLTAYFVGENSAGTESTAAFDDVTLTAKKLVALTRMSSELSEDAAINFGDMLAGEISYAFANKEDECGFNGTGTSTYGGIVGIRTRLDELTAGTAPGLVLGAGNAYSELTLANFESLIGALPVYADVPGQAQFVCHKTFYYTVMVRLILASGGTTGQEIVNGRLVPMFLGYPVQFSQVMPSTEANDQIPVAFGNFMMGARFGDRRQETISFSDQASINSQSLWERDQIGVKGTQRFDINVHDYGSNTEAGPICGLQMAGS